MTDLNQIEKIEQWNICRGRGWAEVVSNAIDEGYLWNPESIYAIDDDWRELEHVRLHLCNNKYGGPYAWVNRDGVAIGVGMGSHDAVAETLLGFNVKDVERTHARVSFYTHTALEAMRYVNNIHQTDEMLLKANEIIKRL